MPALRFAGAQYGRWLPLLLLALVAPLRAQQDGGYTFSLNGKAITPPTFSLNGTPGELRAGDLVQIDYVLRKDNFGRSHHQLLTLGPPGAYRVRATEDRPHAIWRDQGRDSVLMAVSASELPGLSAEARATLAGVRIASWSADIARAIAALPAERIAFTLLDSSRSDQGAVPPLPPGTRALEIHVLRSGLDDYDALRSLRNLRFFQVVGGNWWCDPEVLSSAADLRYLSMGWARLENVDALSRFVQLRHLQAELPLDDLACVLPLRELRVLNLARSKITDLSPLAALPNLEVLDVSFSPATTLPDRGFPRLRSLVLGYTSIGHDQMRPFRRAHPDCQVCFRPDLQVFLATVAGCNRLRVRSGGAFAPQEEKTLFELGDAERVQAILGAIEILEDEDEFSCRCIGSPSLEFYRGDELLATLSLHHGRSVRWDDDRWSSDGLLTDASQRAVCQLLADHGVDDPKRERDARLLREAASRTLWDQRSALLPREVLTAVWKADSEDEALDVLARHAPDSAQRTVLFLRVFGCHEGSWDECDWLDRVLDMGLEQLSKEISTVIEGSSAEPRAAIGAGRFLLTDQRWRELDAETLAGILPRLARAGLEHPQSMNRRLTLRALRDIPGEVATAILRRALDGEFTPRTVASAALQSSGGMVAIYPSDEILEDSETSMRALAALCLSARGDRESLPAIRTLLEQSEGRDREVYAAAVQRLEEIR